MIKKTITYTDFNGEEQTEDFYFNLTRAEALQMEISGEGNSFSEHLKKIVSANKGKGIIDSFKAIIDMSYGERSADGRKFAKSPEILQDFKSTGAYDTLFMELATEPGKGAEFVNGLLPTGTTAEGIATGQSVSEQARAASEARLQGHKKADHEASDIRDISDTARDVTAQPEEDLSKLTKAQLLERLNKK